MDAVKFLQERERICRMYQNCEDCPLGDVTCGGVLNVDAECLVGTVEKWSAAHPVKTRQSVFLEKYPNCLIDTNGVIGTCPRNIDKNYRCDLRHPGGCANCRREFWTQEVE